MSQQTYDPNETILNVLGVVVTQLAKGTFIEVAYDTDAYSDEVGANGNVVRIRSADKRGTIKFTTMAESPSNDELTALAAMDRATGAASGSSFARDFRGTSTHFAASSWLKRVPARKYATEATTVEWEVRCASLLHNVGSTLAI